MNIPYDSKFNSCFYGIYSSLQNQFSFTHGELKILDLITKGVIKQIKDKTNIDIEAHYSCDSKQNVTLLKSWQNRLCTMPIGMFYPAQTSGCCDLPKKRNIDEIKIDLVRRCKKIFDSYENLKKNHEFNETLIFVHSENGYTKE